MVARHDLALEPGRDRRRLVGQVPHAIPVTGAGSAIRGGLDEQPPLGRQPGSAPASPGLATAASAIDAA
jgi:hypothetical protein